MIDDDCMNNICDKHNFLTLTEASCYTRDIKDPGTALMETKPIQVYTNENRL